MKRILVLLWAFHCGMAFACFDTEDVIPMSDLMPSAKRGDASAQFAVGEQYYRGRYDCGGGDTAGVPQNFGKALHWYRLAAKQGYADAAFSIATMYINGEGVAANQKEAHKWLQKAADEGNDQAKSMIANELY